MTRNAVCLMAMLCGCAAGPDAIAPADMTDTSGEGPVGFISLFGTQMPASVLANATFLPGGTAYVCATQSVGACTFYRCTPRPNGSGPQFTSAGAIDVSGGKQPVYFSPRADGTYDTVMFSNNEWSGGETLIAAALGATVPQFTATVTAPHLAMVSAPPLPSTDWAINRSTDVSFTWSGVTTEDVIVTFGSDSQDPIELECHFPGSDGKGTATAAALSLLPTGSGYFEVKTSNASHVSAGNYQVTFSAESDAVAPGGAPFVGGAKFSG